MNATGGARGRERGLRPPVIGLPIMPTRELIACDQPRLAAQPEALHPALDGTKPDTEFGRLIGVPFVEWPAGRILRPRFSFPCRLGRSRAVAGEHFPNVGGPFKQ